MAVQTRPSEATRSVNENVVLPKVLQRAGEGLGLTAQETAQAIGKSRTFFEQGRAQGRIDPHTRQMIALLLRLHRSLSALVDGYKDATTLLREGGDRSDTPDRS